MIVSHREAVTPLGRRVVGDPHRVHRCLGVLKRRVVLKALNNANDHVEQGPLENAQLSPLIAPVPIDVEVGSEHDFTSTEQQRLQQRGQSVPVAPAGEVLRPRNQVDKAPEGDGGDDEVREHEDVGVVEQKGLFRLVVLPVHGVVDVARGDHHLDGVVVELPRKVVVLG